MIEEVFYHARLYHLTRKTTEYFKKHEEKVDDLLYTTVDINTIFQNLALKIKVQIVEEMYNGNIMKIGIYKRFSLNFIGNILPHLKQTYFENFQFIYNIDEVPDKIYFIVEGTVAFLNEDQITWQCLKEGSYFGDVEIFRKSFRDSTTQSTSRCHIFTLGKNLVWNEIKENFNEEFQILLENVVMRYKYYCEVQIIIDEIIKEGKAIYSAGLEKIIKDELKIKFNIKNDNNYYFRFGILERLKQLRSTNSEDQNNGTYNIKAIKNIFSGTIKNFNDESLDKHFQKKRKRSLLNFKEDLDLINDQINITNNTNMKHKHIDYNKITECSMKIQELTSLKRRNTQNVESILLPKESDHETVKNKTQSFLKNKGIRRDSNILITNLVENNLKDINQERSIDRRKLDDNMQIKYGEMNEINRKLDEISEKYDFVISEISRIDKIINETKNNENQFSIIQEKLNEEEHDNSKGTIISRVNDMNNQNNLNFTLKKLNFLSNE